MANIRNQTESKTMAKFRTRLQELREARGWERQDLLREVILQDEKMTYQTVMQWEKHGLSRIDANTAEVFAKIFDCDWHDLFVLVEDDD